MMEPVDEHIRRRPVDNSGVNGAYPGKDDIEPLKNDTKMDKSLHSFRNSLLIAISIPFVILLAFGGHLSIVIMCFGGLVCYIFDLLGAMEMTFMVIVMTLMGLLGSLIWAARVFLTEFSLNFTLVMIMGIILFQLVIIMSSYFKAVVNELSMIFDVLDPLVFATLPVVASSLISWFLCVEVPTLDLEATFTVVYFLYVVGLLSPRYKLKEVYKRNQVSSVPMMVSSESVLIVPLPVMMVVYVLPVCMAPLMHCSLHHNVLSTNKTRIIGVALSFLFPTMLMLFAARRHLAYWPATSRDSVRGWFDRIQVVVVLLTLVCWQDHPMLDEIKSFSGLADPYPTYLLLGAMLLLAVGYSVFKYGEAYRRASDEIDSVSVTSHSRTQTGQYLAMLETVVSFSIGLSTALVSLLVNIPSRMLPISMLGAVAIAEFYHRKSWALTSKVLLVVIGAISLAIVAVAFTRNTVFFLLFGFAWHVDLTMQQFCKWFALLLAAAVIVPAILMPSIFEGVSKSGGGDSSSDLLLPGSSGATSGKGSTLGTYKKLFRSVFLFAMVVLTFVFASSELMMREQDWSSLEVAVETIYPSFYLVGTSSVVAITTAGLYSADIVGPSSLWILLVIQGSKLLHLVGLPSKACFSVGAMLLTYSLPFIRHISEYLLGNHHSQSDAIDKGLSSPGGAKKPDLSTLHTAEVVFYAVSATLATYWARSHIAYTVLRALLNNDELSDLQLNTACFAAWSFNMSCLLLVFVRQAKLLRSVLLGLAVVCTLIATEGLGRLSFAVDPTSSLYLTVALHPDMAANEHTGLFILLSGAMSLCAFVGLIPLTNGLVCAVYTVAFSFISTKAMLGWAFPLSMNDVLLSHDLLAFPFIYIFATKFQYTYFAIRHTEDNPALVQLVFIIVSIMPFGAVLYCYLTGKYSAAVEGIVWSTIVGTASLALSARAREFVSDIRVLNKRAKNTRSPAVGHVVTFACVVSTVLLVFWTSVATAIDVSLDRDLLVPCATLLVLTTKKGTLLPDTHPLVIAAVLCTVWWVASAAHCIFVRGLGDADAALGDFHFQQHSFFGFDHDVSLWTSGLSWWYHMMNITLLLIPLPAVVVSFLRRKNESEEVVLMLAMLSAISIIGGQIGSIRYLGLLGTVFAGWRCNNLVQLKKQSDRLI